MSRIRVAIVGVGNCASSLVQGLAHYAGLAMRKAEPVGLLHPELGGYRIEDIDIVAAFDIDRRKVGTPLHRAIFAAPNNTQIFCPDVPPYDLPGREVIVQMGPILDGVAPHMASYPIDQRFDPAEADPVNVPQLLRDTRCQILLNYLPVGSQQAAEFYAEACLETGVSLINCMPVFLVSHPDWARRFTEAGIPCIGDDIKAQVGATITHRTLARMFDARGATLDSTYQLNTAGNTDFLNMLERSRLASKKISKTEAVQSQLDLPLAPDRIHIGPSDYIPFQRDTKVCYLRIEARGFGGLPIQLELRLNVEDSPNSAGVVVDAIRYCQLARNAGLAGPIDSVSAWAMKHPPRQMADEEAARMVEAFVIDSKPLANSPAIPQ